MSKQMHQGICSYEQLRCRNIHLSNCYCDVEFLREVDERGLDEVGVVLDL